MSGTQETVGVTDQATEPPTNWREQVALLRTPKGLLKIGAYVLLAYLLTSVLLGLLFQVLLFALTLVFARLAFVFTPVYHLAGRMMGVQALPTRLAKPPTWFAIYSAVFILFWLAVVGAIVRVISIAGFCNQNLLCIIWRAPLR